MPDQQNITNIPSNRVEFIDPRTGLVSREWYRFFLNLFNLAGAGGNQISLDEMQIGPPPQPVSDSGGGGGSGTVTSVDVSGGTTGLTTTGGPITSSGTITLEGTLNVANGGTGATNATTARVNLVAAKSGANSDITSLDGVTGGISTPDYIDFDTAAAPARATGRLWWDNADGIQTLNLGMAGSNATMQIGEEIYFRIKASAAITEGQVVMFTGTVGASGALQGAPATGLTASTAQYVMGVATESIAHNGWGYVTQFGLVRGIDTSGGAEAWVDGQILYYDPSVTGGLTKNLPSAPNAKVVVAAVIYASASNGSLFVRPSFGGELGQYEGDVQVTTPAAYNLLQRNSANTVWQNVATLESMPIGSTTPAAATFTTLTATGQTSLGGAAGSEGLRVTPLASSTTYINARAGVNGGNAQFGLNGTGNTDFIQYTLGTGAFRFLTNGIGVDQFRITHTASAVNYVQVTGAATLTGGPTLSAQGSDFNIPLRLSSKGTGGVELGNPAGWAGLTVTTTNNPNRIALNAPATGFIPTFSTAGVDTNAGMAFISKGTGAIDLAAGSRGVNISNGGTVTAYTRTNPGTNLWLGTTPTVTVSAPTTAGGVQAVIAVQGYAASATIQSGGTGYTVGDTLTMTGGTGGPATFTVSTVSAGVITAVAPLNFSQYATVPTNPVSVTGGTGSGATLNVSYGLGTSFSITNAGSGYVEQPTLTISGQTSGSGAAAYATVGSGTTVKSLGSTMSFTTAGGEQFRVSDNAGATQYISAVGSSTGNVAFNFAGSGTGGFSYVANSGSHRFWSSGATEQFRVSHTASAVNYVQVTGAATGGAPNITAQGSDANVALLLKSKGTYACEFQSSAGTILLQALPVASSVNYLRVSPAVASSAPVLSAQGSDTNIDLALTPKGTGVVRTSGTGIRLYGSSSGYVGLTGAAAAGSTTYTLPAADGTSGQALSTNGSGTLSWATPASSNVTAQGLWENNATISSNYSITSGNNALSSGPVTVATGVTVTVPSGSVWTIV